MSFSNRIGSDRTAADFRRGLQLASKAHYREALKCFNKVLTMAPAHLDALNCQSDCLVLLGRHLEAIAGYDRLLAARPNDLNVRSSRASALKSLGRLEEAMAGYDAVLADDPNHPDALFNRGNLRLDFRRPTDAIRDLRRAHSLRPNDPEVQTSIIFALNFDEHLTTEDLQAERAKWGHDLNAPGSTTHANDASPDRKLRIGYVSSHFRHQAATYAFGGVIVCHDPTQFEIVCYSDTIEEDAVSRRLQHNVAKWRRTADLSDDQLAKQVRKDGIDILVDLVGHMKGNRLRAFALKPAPVQITAWGEPTGTGLRAIDYLFADPVVIPTAERALLAERVADLPNFLGFWTPDPLPPVGPLPALERGYVTFGSFNRAAKLIDPVLRRWSAILRAVPNSRLVLKDRPLEQQRSAIVGTMAEEGISDDRVTLLGHVDRADHFALYREVDIALDPSPHGGGMTTLDALWMGVPVVTAPGRIPSSRIAAASLTAAGLSDFIAPDHQGFVQLATDKANDLASLAQLRAGLRDRVANTEFGDPVRYTRAVERHYRSMWRRWCEGQKSVEIKAVPEPETES
jgi:predicted O-linked N-acetylglucosamine transferase (SPINDLY family)